MVSTLLRGMLQAMQQTTANLPSPASPSFAGLLASLAAPTPRTAWNNDDLAEDVATLRYEHALRAHARYRADEPIETAKALGDTVGAVKTSETSEDAEMDGARTPSLWTAPGWNGGAESGVAQESFATLEANRKCASITIRLSKTECDQLRRRAAQAGLTVSAYLRSCTFEAEALRAQVKDVLAELRQSTAAFEERRPAARGRRWIERILRLIPRWQRDRGMAGA